jgi:hypothetical protein
MDIYIPIVVAPWNVSKICRPHIMCFGAGRYGRYVVLTSGAGHSCMFHAHKSQSYSLWKAALASISPERETSRG